MISFSPSTVDDIDQIVEWTKHDPYHFHQGQPEWWLTEAEGSLLAFCLMDKKGPVAYVRLDVDGDFIRIHTQFAPEAVVSKRRLVVGMIAAVKKLIEFYSSQTIMRGFIFNSINPSLIMFMDKHLGFKPAGDDDYWLIFEGK
jgi:hypothetical protein